MSARALAVLLWVLVACAPGVGEPCAENLPCPMSLQCVLPFAGAEAGVCDHAPGGFGARCEDAVSCAEGLTCSSHFTSGERYGTCVHQRQDGELCVVDRDCVSGHCEPSPSGAGGGRCVP